MPLLEARGITHSVERGLFYDRAVGVTNKVPFRDSLSGSSGMQSSTDLHSGHRLVFLYRLSRGNQLKLRRRLLLFSHFNKISFEGERGMRAFFAHYTIHGETFQTFVQRTKSKAH